MEKFSAQPIQLLLVEDNPDDVDLTIEAFKDARLKVNLDVVDNGQKALDYMYKKGDYQNVSTPDMVLLDLNLPIIDGREVLTKIKTDANLCKVPVIVLTTSLDSNDIDHAYSRHANAYLAKPVDFTSFLQVVKAFEEFWLSVVKLPKDGQ